MRAWVVSFFMVNSRGIKLGSDPVVFEFYAPGFIDVSCRAFSRMLLEYGRSIGLSGSYVCIVSIK